jgi:tRNA-modifying protein YgfZ
MTAPAMSPDPVELIWLTGQDAVRFINDLISQEVGSAVVGEVRRSLLLTPKGRIDFILWALRDQDRVGLVTEDGRGEELVSRLSRYRIRVEVAIDRSTSPATVIVGDIGQPDGGWISTGDGILADVSWTGVRRALVMGEPPDFPMLEKARYEYLRIQALEPLVGVDLDDATIPQETRLVESTVAFDKGCFLGQELVARLHNRGGRVNRHLRVVDFGGSIPKPGAHLFSGEEDVGIVTSSAGGLGLVNLKRGVDTGATVAAGGHQGVVIDTPSDDVASS